MTWVHDSNFKLFLIEEDGNCLFRAMSHQLYGSQDHHEMIRQRCCDYIELDRQYFEGFMANAAGNMTFSYYLHIMHILYLTNPLLRRSVDLQYRYAPRSTQTLTPVMDILSLFIGDGGYVLPVPLRAI